LGGDMAMKISQPPRVSTEAFVVKLDKVVEGTAMLVLAKSLQLGLAPL